MRALLVIPFAALASGCPSPPCNTAPIPVSTPVADGGLGDPCGYGAGTCAPGLSCQMFRASAIAFQACSIGCSDGGCPMGAACLATNFTQGIPLCVPTCTTDSDCASGVRAGTCARFSADAGACEPIQCAPPGYGNLGFCPSTYTCVDFGPCGCNPEHPCDETPGWCERADAGS